MLSPPSSRCRGTKKRARKNRVTTLASVLSAIVRRQLLVDGVAFEFSVPVQDHIDWLSHWSLLHWSNHDESLTIR